MLLVESPVPGHVILAVMDTFPSIALGYLESVNRTTGQMKVDTRNVLVLSVLAAAISGPFAALFLVLLYQA